MLTGTLNRYKAYYFDDYFSQMHKEIMQKTDSIKELEEQIEVMTEEMAKVCILLLFDC